MKFQIGFTNQTRVSFVEGEYIYACPLAGIWNLYIYLSDLANHFLRSELRNTLKSSISSRSNLPHSTYGKSRFLEWFSVKTTNSSSERPSLIYEATKSVRTSLRELILSKPQETSVMKRSSTVTVYWNLSLFFPAKSTSSLPQPHVDKVTPLSVTVLRNLRRLTIVLGLGSSRANHACHSRDF